MAVTSQVRALALPLLTAVLTTCRSVMGWLKKRATSGLREKREEETEETAIAISDPVEPKDDGPKRKYTEVGLSTR